MEQVIQTSLAELPDVDWRIYPPQTAPSAELMPNQTRRPRMTIGRAAVLGLIDRYVSIGFGYRLSLLEVQKLVLLFDCGGRAIK